MMPPDAWPLLVTLPAGFAGGVLVGTIYFRAVRATAELIVTGGRPVLAIVATVGRIGLLGLSFAVALQAGGLILLAALAGVLTARGLTIRSPRSASI